MHYEEEKVRVIDYMFSKNKLRIKGIFESGGEN